MYAKNVLMLLASAVIGFGAAAADETGSFDKAMETLKMLQNGLPFNLIKDFQEYKIVATHYRTDKKELRYILANTEAFEALKNNRLPLPEGSKVVKIGWNVKAMGNFPDALEADEVQRIEYMVKDSKNYPADGWGYARFVKTDGGYRSWDKGTQGCVSCHAAASDNDFLFTRYQKLH
ncbi:cytochrome P460 family protein [Sulfurimonas sp. HSL3-7]|uniref:cytochrome P460 family protein n=1 Tax=Sulfonitrofixus jiaomeiensis TaxID=3131938 RepID=UPI0031F9C7E5